VTKSVREVCAKLLVELIPQGGFASDNDARSALATFHRQVFALDATRDEEIAGVKVVLSELMAAARDGDLPQDQAQRFVRACTEVYRLDRPERTIQ
jgi:hypothetical protein